LSLSLLRYFFLELVAFRGMLYDVRFNLSTEGEDVCMSDSQCIKYEFVVAKFL